MLPESSSSSTTSSCWVVAVSATRWLCPALVPAVLSAGVATRSTVPVVRPPAGGVAGALKRSARLCVWAGATARGSGVCTVNPVGSAGFTDVIFSVPVPLFDTWTLWSIVSLISDAYGRVAGVTTIHGCAVLAIESATTQVKSRLTASLFWIPSCQVSVVSWSNPIRTWNTSVASPTVTSWTSPT